jgi:multiple sugar transport system ATP-binding protein
MRTEIKRLHKKTGTTIVYVTHDQIEAMTMATKICVLEGGHI